MRLQALRQFALSLPHTTWVKQWGECLVFKVAAESPNSHLSLFAPRKAGEARSGPGRSAAGKMFLILVLEAETLDGVIFKCTPEEFDELTEIEGIAQAPYCAKRHWVRVSDLLALKPAELERRIRRSYDLVVAGLPKKTQAALAATVQRP